MNRGATFTLRKFTFTVNVHFVAKCLANKKGLFTAKRTLLRGNNMFKTLFAVVKRNFYNHKTT